MPDYDTLKVTLQEGDNDVAFATTIRKAEPVRVSCPGFWLTFQCTPHKPGHERYTVILHTDDGYQYDCRDYGAQGMVVIEVEGVHHA